MDPVLRSECLAGFAVVSANIISTLAGSLTHGDTIRK